MVQLRWRSPFSVQVGSLVMTHSPKVWVLLTGMTSVWVSSPRMQSRCLEPSSTQVASRSMTHSPYSWPRALMASVRVSPQKVRTPSAVQVGSFVTTPASHLWVLLSTGMLSV